MRDVKLNSLFVIMNNRKILSRQNHKTFIVVCDSK